MSILLPRVCPDLLNGSTLSNITVLVTPRHPTPEGTVRLGKEGLCSDLDQFIEVTRVTGGLFQVYGVDYKLHQFRD